MVGREDKTHKADQLQCRAVRGTKWPHEDKEYTRYRTLKKGYRTVINELFED